MTAKIKLYSSFNLEEKELGSESDELLIEGYANTTTTDRHGDVIPESAWTESAVANYRKNPIILAFHDHSKPIGKTVEMQADAKGFKIKAKISKAAGEIYDLIKEGILRTFSIGFMVKDAKYDSVSDIFVIKELELFEVSVVSVPANQDSVFDLAKAFDSEADYMEFKKAFAPASEEGTPAAVTPDTTSNTEELNMDKEELEKIVKAAADAAVAANAEAAAKSAAETAAKAAAAVSVQLGQTGAEKLLADVEKRLAEGNESLTKALEGLRGELAEKSAEIEALRKSRAVFEEKGAADQVSMTEKSVAVLLAKTLHKPITETKAFANLVQKYGAHVPSELWEDQVSTNMMDEIRRQLVVAPRFRSINMPGVNTTFPVNPEAGYGTWVTVSQYGTDDSSGAAQTHALKEISITAHKLATKEFITNEEDYDAIIALLPIIRDAMVRRTAKSWDKALLLGAATTADPIKGVVRYEATGSNVTKPVGAAVTTADLRSLRKNLGVWGLNPSDVIFFVNTETYYELLEDETFQTMDKVGDRATVITGQIGMVGNSPVVVTGELPAKAIGGFGAIAINVSNFMVGNYRGLNLESEYSAEKQRRVLIASLRTGFQQISTVDGQAVSCLRYIANP